MSPEVRVLVEEDEMNYASARVMEAVAEIVAIQIRVEGMKAEDAYYQHRGEAPTHCKDEYAKLAAEVLAWARTIGGYAENCK